MAKATLADRLRLVRSYSEASARKISAVAGLSPSHVGYLETTAHANPEARTLEALARVFGVTVGWLLNGEGKPPTAEGVRRSVAARALERVA